MAKSAQPSGRQAKQLFRVCMVDGRLDAGRARKVVQRIVESKRRGYLRLLTQFRRLINLEQSRHKAEVACAASLPPDLRDSVQGHLQRLYGTGVKIEFTHHPELIGGIRIRVGSDIYDGSVQSELAALEKSF